MTNQIDELMALVWQMRLAVNPDAHAGRVQSALEAALKPGEAHHWIVPEFGFLFSTEDAAQRYLENIGSQAKPTACYTTAPPAQTPDVGLDFEDWAKAYSTLSLERDSEGVYVDMNQEMLWHAFQAGAKA